MSANKISKSIFIFMVFLSLTSCKDRACLKELKLEKGRISIPCEWSYKKESPVDDFIVYSFADSLGVEVLFLYVGNHSSPLEPRGDLIKSIEIKGADYSRKERVWTSSEKRFNGGVDIEFTSYGWPEMLQFAYSDLESQKKEQVDSIINSFSLSK